MFTGYNKKIVSSRLAKFLHFVLLFQFSGFFYCSSA